MNIISPMPRGNGAFVLHRCLEASLPGYRVHAYDPRLTLFPPLLRLLRFGPGDLVHTLPDHAVFAAPPGMPLVLTFQNYVLDPGMRPISGPLRHFHNHVLLRRFTLAALERARAVAAVSRDTATLVREDLGWDGPLRLIYNGIDVERFRPPASPRPERPVLDVLFSGNMTRRKGFHLLPEIIRRTSDHVHIWYTAGLRTRSRAPAHPRLHPLGPVAWHDMPDLYRRMDVLLAPTVREGLSLAVAEAMACGLPVVASDCSSLPEMVVPDKGGFLCRPGDAADFAERLNMLAAAPDRRPAMGAFNRERATTLFSQARMVEEYRRLFEEAVAGAISGAGR